MAHRLQMVNHTVSIQNSAAQSDFFDRKYFFDVCRIIPVSSWQSQWHEKYVIKYTTKRCYPLSWSSILACSCSIRLSWPCNLWGHVAEVGWGWTIPTIL